MIARVFTRRLSAVLFTVSLALVAATAARAQQFAFQSYGADRGLPNLGIVCVAQDRAGFLVTCTENGVYRFDGRSFSRYGVSQGLPERGISGTFSTLPDGRVVVVASGGVYVAADENSRFTKVSGIGLIDSDDHVKVAPFQNGVLVLNNDQLMLVDTKHDAHPEARPFLSAFQLQANPELQTVTSMAASGDTLWLGCADGHLCRLTCTPPPTPTGVGDCSDVTVLGQAEGIPDQNWVTLLVDRAGELWARSPDQVLVSHAHETRFTVEPVPGGVGRYVGRNDRLSLVEGPDGSILTPGPSGLLVRRNGRWVEIDQSHGLPDGEIAAILFDREGSLWLGVRGQGLARAVGWGEWQNWTTAENLSANVIWQLARQRGGPLLIATERGVNALAASGPDRITQPGLDGPTYAVAVTPGGHLWSANLAGQLRRYSPTSRTIDATFHVPIADVLAMDRFGGLLMSTNSGLYRLADPDAPVPTPPTLIPGTHGHIHTFAQDAGGFVWMVMDGSLVRLDPTGRQPTVIELTTFASTPRAMRFISPDDLWLGSDDAGLQHVMLVNGRPGRIMAIDRPNEMLSQVVSIDEDRRGWVWIGTDRGVDVWNGHEWQHLDQEDGLLSGDVDEGSILADPDGSMWFGTAHGLSHMLDPSTVFDKVSLDPVITQVLLDGAPLAQASIPWSHASLTVRFAALDFRLSDSIRFRYRLEGVDRDWVETSDSTVRYPSLPSGHLVFSVEAIAPARHQSSAPVSFSLDVRPPWWATVWFYALAAVAIIVAARVVWRLRIRLLLARQRHLEELVTVRTAEIAEAHAALLAQAARDGLTGLLNRGEITARLDALIADPAHRVGLAVALADLDHFKAINDVHGHFGGDEVLRQVSSRLSCALVGGEVAGRYGGEEFVIVLPGPGDPMRRLEAIRAAMTSGAVRADDADIDVTCSFGLALLQPGENGEAVLRRADRLLYRAKDAGRDRIMAEP